MLNKLLIIAGVAGVVAMTLFASTAAAAPVKGAFIVVAGDSTAKSNTATPAKDKSSRKKSDAKSSKASRSSGDNIVEPDSVDEEDEGADQAWDSELYVKGETPAVTEAPTVLAK